MSALALAILLACARGPTPPPGTAEGDIIELGGELFQLKNGVLYTLDDPALEDDRYTVTVTSSLLDQNKRDKVVRTDTISNEDIARSGARTLADVLETQAGIQVGSSLGLGQQVQMDGLDGRHVLILVDGKPVTGRVNNRVDVGRIPVSAASIERVEIVRGPMSALYGSEALGGVVNIITKKPKLQNSAEATTFVDVLQGQVWRGAGLHLVGGVEPVAGRLDVDVSDMPGVDRGGTDANDKSDLVPDGRDDLPSRRQLAFHGDLAVPLFDNASLRAAADASQSTSAARLAPAVPFMDRSRNADLSGTAGLEVDVTDSTTLTTDIFLSRFRHVFEKVPRGTLLDTGAPFCGAAAVPFVDGACPSDPAVRTDATADQARLESRVTSTLFEGGSLNLPFDPGDLQASAGVLLLVEEAMRRNGDGEDTLPGGGSRDSAALYGEALWRPWPWLALSPGFRLDAFTPSTAKGGNTALGPKISARADLPLGFFVRASYGRGFRLPSFEERFLRFDHSEIGYIVEGNEDLQPEQSHGTRGELGFSPIQELELSIEGYLNVVDNLIAETLSGLDNQGVPIFTYANRARAYTAGINARTRIGPFFGAALDFSYQYMANAVDASACPEDNPYFCSVEEGAVSLPLRPAHSVAGTLRYTVAATSTQLFVRVNGMSERILNATISSPGFVLFATGVKQPIMDVADLQFSVQNLLDTYDAAFGPKPGRRVSLSLSVKL
jgi:outer membrane receptor for ferrienterochelin and colicins